MDKDLVLGVSPRSTMLLSVVFGAIGTHSEGLRKGAFFGITSEFGLLIVRVTKVMGHIVLWAFGIDVGFVVGSAFRV